MYKISTRNTNNIVAKTRRTIHQPDATKQPKLIANGHCKVDVPENMASPTLVFKKSPTKNQTPHVHSPPIIQNQDEMIRYVQSSWAQVMQEYETSQRQGTSKVVYYEPPTTNNTLHDFKPFELEEWFVKRMLQNLDLDPSITA